MTALVRVHVMLLVAGCALAVSRPAAAQSTTVEQTASSSAPERRWAFGMQIGALDRPAGHLGIPVDGDGKMGVHLPFAFVGRYQLDDRTALSAGLGTPSGAMGLAVWAGYDLAWPIADHLLGNARLEIYEASGLQIGFAGPDYFARHDNEYVGYGYGYNPPFAFAIRLPIGVRVRWLGNRFDTHLEGAESLALTPSVEANFELAAGASLHF